ncbi:hypothetical protein [Paenibacillus planticolens]|uniref:Uncharacterized protein n=1 Tax=Paenibacillus planticolens TaxID=2654976 RepID=A0ABX1ZTB8_9BACL|nr:hypothetical protein [Paenibacillus planticolens]NOV02089.1 hypothetical protein [Paenibacillus planticolens]
MSQLLEKLEEMLKQIPGGVTEGPVGNVLQKLGEIQAAMDANMDDPTSSQLLNKINAEISKLNLGESTWTDLQNVLNQVRSYVGPNFLSENGVSGLFDGLRQLASQINVSNPTPESLAANMTSLRGLAGQAESFVLGQMKAVNFNQDTLANVLKQLKVLK